MKQPRLTRQLVLENPDRIQDGAGGYSESWTALGTHWAELRAKSGRLADGQTGQLSATGFQVTLRAAPLGQESRPRAGQRFRAGTRLFRIEAVTEADVQERYLVCHCNEELVP
jgi:head-tail adaptor